MENRILLGYTYKNRELWGLERIKSSLLAIDPSAQIKIVARYGPDFWEIATNFKPTIMVSQAPTAITVSHDYYLLKHRFNTRIMCIPTEGIAIYSNLDTYKSEPHLDSYGPNLVDGFLFWGNDYLQSKYDELNTTHKISSYERVLVTGSPLLEALLKGEIALPSSLEPFFSKYTKDKIVLCAPTFISAEYSREMLIRSGDFFVDDPVEFEKKLDILEEHCKVHAEVREVFVEQIILAASRNNDLLFIVNSHPVERNYMDLKGKNIYRDKFKDISNVVYIEEIVDAIVLMQHVACVIHLGSSGIYGAYISGAKSLELDISSYFEKVSNEYDMGIVTGFQSTFYENIDDLNSFITREKENFKTLDFNPAYDKFLYNALNYKRDEEYSPSMLMAQAILDTERFGYQDIECSELDMFYLKKLLPSEEQDTSPEEEQYTQPTEEHDVPTSEKQNVLLVLLKKCIIGTPLESIARKFYAQLKKL